MKVPRHPSWDPVFLEYTMDDLQETITEALKSRKKVFEETITIRNFRETVTITVKKERRV